MKISSPKNAATQTDHFLIGCGLFVFAVTALWAVFFVPMNMDETGIYHALACINYPFAVLQDFRDSCVHQVTLTMPLTGLDIIHSQRYTGILHSILYAPFYFLFHRPGAQYAFNLCFLLAFAYLLSRETKKPVLSLALFLSFFPFAFQFIHDTGPVAFALLVFPLATILFRRILQAQSSVAYGYAAVLALLITAATEDKPFFLYLLPSLVLFVLALTADRGNLRDLMTALKKAHGPVSAAAILTVIGLLLILFSVNQEGKYYLTWLMEIRTEEPARAPWIDLFTSFMLYWPAYAHYFYNLHADVGLTLFELASAGFAGLCVIIAIQGKFLSSGTGLRCALLGLSFASTACIFMITGNAWAGHHFIFLWAPLIVLLADLVTALPTGPAAVIAMVFFALNLWSTAALTQEDIQVRNSGERYAIFHYFDDDAFASDAIVNYSTWGGYYIQALYGPKNQLVTYTDPLIPQDAERLFALSRETGRKIYDVCFGPYCNAPTLKSLFGGRLDFDDVLPGLPNWHVFAATPGSEKDQARTR